MRYTKRHLLLSIANSELVKHNNREYLVIGGIYFGQVTFGAHNLTMCCDGVGDIGHVKTKSGKKFRQLSLASSEMIENRILELNTKGIRVFATVTDRHLDPESEYSEQGIPFLLDSTN